MSFIYEALKRAEDDNQQRVTAPARMDASAAAAQRRSRWWLWALIGVLAANAALFGVWMFGRTLFARTDSTVVAGHVPSPPPAGGTPATREPGTETSKPAPPVAAAKDVPSVETAKPLPPLVVPPSVVAPRVSPVDRPHAGSAAPVGDRPREAAAPPPAVVAEPPARRAPVVAPTPPAVVSEPPSKQTPIAAPQPPAVAEPATKRTPVEVPAPPAVTADTPAKRTPGAAPASPAAVAAEPPAKRTPAATPTPAPRGASPAERGTDRVATVAPPSPSTPVDPPKITLQVLVYSDTPAQRMVFIDGQRYAEGDAIDAETVLERITPDSAVVKRRGQRFVISERR